MPVFPENVDPKYRAVFNDPTYAAVPVRKAAVQHKATPLPAHKEPLKSPVGVGKAWKGRRR